MAKTSIDRRDLGEWHGGFAGAFLFPQEVASTELFEEHMRHQSLAMLTAALALFLCHPPQSQASDQQKNATGLPTYPTDKGGLMDSTFREFPNGKQCIHYSGDTNDALVDVEAWYRKALPGARVDDVNKDSLYGSITLIGIKLLSGNDIVNIYRLPNGDHTVIEMMKCK